MNSPCLVVSEFALMSAGSLSLCCEFLSSKVRLSISSLLSSKASLSTSSLLSTAVIHPYTCDVYIHLWRFVLSSSASADVMAELKGMFQVDGADGLA